MPNAKSIALVVGIALGVSFLCNIFLGTTSEVSVWKKTSIESIHRIGALETENRNINAAINNMSNELKALDDEQVKAILNKYGIK